MPSPCVSTEVSTDVGSRVPAVDPAPSPAGTGGRRPAGDRSRSLSPSRAADFVQCPLLYRFRVVDGLPEPASPAAVRGTVVHAVLGRLFDLPAASRTVAAARDLLGPQWERMLAEEPALAELFDGDDAALTAWLDSADRLLGRWFELEDPTRLEPAERELYVETDLEQGLRLRGYVDRLDVAPGGEVRVVDYKTGRAPSERFESRALFQMRFYALVLWRSRGVLPRVLQLVYLGSGEVLRYSPDEAELRATERKVLALWQAIARAAETGDWRPSPGRLCDWCHHKPLCPAHGGTPPPLPGDAAARASGTAAGHIDAPGRDEG